MGLWKVHYRQRQGTPSVSETTHSKSIAVFPLAVEFLSQPCRATEKETAGQNMQGLLGKTRVVAHRQEDRANGPAGPTSPETGAMDSEKGWGPKHPLLIPQVPPHYGCAPEFRP